MGITFKKQYYLFDSRILTHVLFWLLYFLLFGFIWAENGDYRTSYFLEFLLLPVRMMAVYVTLYLLVPGLLRQGKNSRFIVYYSLVLAVSGILQRIVSYLFFEWITIGNTLPLLSFHHWMRAMILINSTVLFLLTIKVVLSWQQDVKLLDHYKQLVQKNQSNHLIEIRSENRNYKIPLNDILYIEGLGNYVTIHLANQKIVSYSSLKDLLIQLPEQFVRIHKSFIVNKKNIISYNNEDVEINGRMIPIGRSYKKVSEKL